MTTEEDIARLFGADRAETASDSGAKAELDEVWAMIVAAGAMLRAYPFDTDKRACARQLAHVARRQIETLKKSTAPDKTIRYMDHVTALNRLAVASR